MSCEGSGRGREPLATPGAKPHSRAGGTAGAGGPARFPQSWRVVTPRKAPGVKASSPRAATSSIGGVRSGWGGGGEKGTAGGGRGRGRGYLRGQEDLQTASLARGLPLPGSPRPTSPPRSCRFPHKSRGPSLPGFSSRLPARSPESLTRQDPGSPALFPAHPVPRPAAWGLGVPRPAPRAKPGLTHSGQTPAPAR